MAYFQQPNIDPVILRLWGPFQIRWYSLLYVGGFLVGRAILKRLSKMQRFLFTSEDVEQLIVWLLVGAVVGARIIYCVFYDPKNLLANPLYLFQVYNGGLSFHGGLLGLVVAGIVFGRKKGIPVWNLFDAMCIAGPPGLAMGRLGNFVNGELWGRVSYVPWAVVFRTGGPEPRHPSQLYELFFEGIFLFALLWFLKDRVKKDGTLTMVFLIGYSVARFFIEFFREPDAHLGFIALGLSMGQLLCLAMLAVSVLVGWFCLWRPKSAGSRGA